MTPIYLIPIVAVAFAWLATAAPQRRRDRTRQAAEAHAETLADFDQRNRRSGLSAAVTGYVQSNYGDAMHEFETEIERADADAVALDTRIDDRYERVEVSRKAMLDKFAIVLGGILALAASVALVRLDYDTFRSRGDSELLAGVLSIITWAVLEAIGITLLVLGGIHRIRSAADAANETSATDPNSDLTSRDGANEPSTLVDTGFGPMQRGVRNGAVGGLLATTVLIAVFLADVSVIRTDKGVGSRLRVAEAELVVEQAQPSPDPFRVEVTQSRVEELDNQYRTSRIMDSALVYGTVALIILLGSLPPRAAGIAYAVALERRKRGRERDGRTAQEQLDRLRDVVIAGEIAALMVELDIEPEAFAGPPPSPRMAGVPPIGLPEPPAGGRPAPSPAHSPDSPLPGDAVPRTFIDLTIPDVPERAHSDEPVIAREPAPDRVAVPADERDPHHQLAPTGPQLDDEPWGD